MFESYHFIIIEIIIVLVLTFFLLFYYARRNTNPVVLIVAYFSWVLNFILVLLVPFDIYYTQTEIGIANGMPSTTESMIKIGYNITYWVLFVDSWFIIPLMEEYESSGEYTKAKKLKSSIKSNVIFFGILGGVCIIAIIFAFLYFGFNIRTFNIIKNFSLLLGMLIFFFLFSYSLVNYPKTLYENINYSKQIQYYEWESNHFFDQLSEDIYKLGINYSQIRQTIDKVSSKNSIRINKAIKSDLEVLEPNKEKEQKLEDYLIHMQKEYDEFSANLPMYGLTRIKKDEDEGPLNSVDKLIKLNSKNFFLKQDDLRMKGRICYNYKKWATLNMLYYSNNAQNDKEAKTKLINNVSLQEEGFIPLNNFSSIKLIYYSKIKKYLNYIFLFLSIAVGIFALVCEMLIIFNVNIFNYILEKNTSIVAIHFIILISFIYLILMSFYTMFKIKITNYIYMHSHRQTDPVSLMKFSSHISRICFSICINFLQMIDQFSDDKKTIFEEFFSLKMDEGKSETAPILKICRYFPIILLVLVILFIFNIQQRIKKCLEIEHFEYENEDRNNGIKDGHKKLMQLNKILDGRLLNYEENKIFEISSHI